MRQQTLKFIFTRTLLLIPASIVFAQYRIFVFGIPWYVPEVGVLIAIPLFFALKEGCLPVRNRFLWYAAGLLFAGFIWSAAAHDITAHGYGRIKSWFLFPMLYAYFTVVAVRGKQLLREDLWISIFIGGIGVGIATLFGVFFGTAFSYDHRLHGFFSSPNQLAMILGTASIFGGAAFLQGLGSRRKSLFFLMGIVFLGALLVCTQSYEVFFALVIVMAIFLMRHYRRMSFRMIMALSAAVLFATLAFLSLSGEKWRGILAEDNRSSWASRQMIWHSAARMIADSPLTGIGPGNFQGQYLAYQRYFPPYLEWSVPHPHNMFLDIWLEGGILGVCGFVGLFFSGGVRSLRNFLDKKNEGRISPSLTFLILVYFLCIGMTDVPFLGNGLAYFFAASLSMCFTGICDRSCCHDD